MNPTANMSRASPPRSRKSKKFPKSELRKPSQLYDELPPTRASSRTTSLASPRPRASSGMPTAQSVDSVASPPPSPLDAEHLTLKVRKNRMIGRSSTDSGIVMADKFDESYSSTSYYRVNSQEKFRQDNSSTDATGVEANFGRAASQASIDASIRLSTHDARPSLSNLQRNISLTGRRAVSKFVDALQDARPSGGRRNFFSEGKILWRLSGKEPRSKNRSRSDEVTQASVSAVTKMQPENAE